VNVDPEQVDPSVVVTAVIILIEYSFICLLKSNYCIFYNKIEEKKKKKSVLREIEERKNILVSSKRERSII
jgi:hypothetical protein